MQVLTIPTCVQHGHPPRLNPHESYVFKCQGLVMVLRAKIRIASLTQESRWPRWLKFAILRWFQQGKAVTNQDKPCCSCVCWAVHSLVAGTAQERLSKILFVLAKGTKAILTLNHGEINVRVANSFFFFCQIVSHYVLHLKVTLFGICNICELGTARF